MKEKKFERKVYDLEKELENEKELKKKLYEIYFSNLEENLHLLLTNQKEFLNDLFQKTNFCLTIQFSPKFFELEESNEINEDFKQNFEENIFDPLEKFIEEEISLTNKKAKNIVKSN